MQLAAANNRYQEALVQLHAERARAGALEVRAAPALALLSSVPAPGAAGWLRLGPAPTSCACCCPASRTPRPLTRPCPALPCLPPAALLPSAPQREAREARDLLSAANSRYSELAERYDAERAKAEALEVSRAEREA